MGLDSGSKSEDDDPNRARNRACRDQVDSFAAKPRMVLVDWIFSRGSIHMASAGVMKSVGCFSAKRPPIFISERNC